MAAIYQFVRPALTVDVVVFARFFRFDKPRYDRWTKQGFNFELQDASS